MSKLATADYAVICGFFVVMVAIGLYFHGRMRNMSDFFSGGKQVPWWLAGVSFYMCSFSALGFVAYSALAYQYGWIAVTIYWLTVPGMIIGAYFFAARWRRVARTSPLEYIEQRFGNPMRQALVWLGIPARLLDDSLKLLAIGTVVAVGLNFPIEIAIIASGIIMISYTFMGGLWAALVADFIQFIVLIAAVIVLPFLVFARVGGVGAFLDHIPAGFFNLTNETYSFSYILIFFFIILLNYSTSWALVQRYYSVSSDKNARKVGYLVAVLNFIGPPIFYIPAMVARVFLPDIQNTNEVYAIVCKSVLPVGMLGMIIAAMFSATMSMLAGDFNAVASVLTNDVFKRMISRQASSRLLLLVARLSTLIIGGVVIGTTFLIRRAQGTDDLFRVMVKIFGLLIPPIALPMLLGMLTRKISNAGGLLGLCSGITLGLTAFCLSYWFPILLQEQVITILTSVTTLSGMIIGTLIRPGSHAQRRRINDFFLQLDNPSADFVADESDTVVRGRISPFPIISLGTFAIGLVLAVSVLLTQPFADSLLSLIIGGCMMATGIIFWTLSYHRNID